MLWQLNNRSPAMLGSWIALILLGTACNPSVQAPAERADAPKGAVGRAVVALSPQTTATVDPAKEGGASDFVNLEAMYNRLTETPKDSLEHRPGLATVWNMSADGLTWDFKIRKGVRFHNGDELTPEDVVYTIERVKQVGRPENKAYLEANLNSVVTQGDSVVFSIKRPNWLFLAEISGAGYSVLPKRYTEEVGEDGFGKAPVGTGPFKFVAWAKQEYLKLEAVDYEHFLWQPGVKQLEYRTVPEETTRLAMMRTEEADLAQVSVTSLKTLEGDGKLRPIKVPNVGGLRLFMFGQHDPQNPMSKLEVRQALSLAIDRQAIADGIYRGYARPSAVSIWNPNREGWPAWGFDPPKVDLEKARGLLSKAGYPDGKGLKFTVHNFEYGALPLFTQVAPVLASQWQKLGMQVELRQWAWGAYAAAARANKLEPVSVSTHLANSGTSDIGYVNDFLLGENYQYASGVANGAHQEAKTMAEQWIRELDAGRRADLLQKVLQYDRDNLASIPVLAMDGLWAAGPRLVGYTPRPGTVASGNMYTVRVTP